MNNQHVCTWCRITGRNGAQYLLVAAGHEPRRVHKPCGEKALAHPSAPKGKIVMSDELAKERDRERSARFWGSQPLTDAERERRARALKPPPLLAAE